MYACVQCLYACMFACMHVCMCWVVDLLNWGVCVHVHMYLSMYVHVGNADIAGVHASNTCMYVCVCACVYVCLHACNASIELVYDVM